MGLWLMRMLLNIICTKFSVNYIFYSGDCSGRKLNLDTFGPITASRGDARAQVGELVGGNPPVPAGEGEKTQAAPKARCNDQGERPYGKGCAGNREEDKSGDCRKAWHKTLGACGGNVQLVVDANIIAAALLKESTTRLLLLSEGMELFAPEFLAEEIGKY